MTIKCCSAVPNLSYLVAARVESLTGLTLEVEQSERPFGLYHGTEVNSSDIMTLHKALAPFRPPILACEDLPQDGMLVSLKPEKEDAISEMRVDIGTDCREFLQRLLSEFSDGGFTIGDTELGIADFNSIKTGSKDPFVRQYLQWVAEQMDVQANAITLSDLNEESSQIVLMDPNQAELPPEQRFLISLICDDMVVGKELEALLVQAGFPEENVKLTLIESDDDEEFYLDCGPLKNDRFRTLRRRLMADLSEYHEASDIDQQDYPVRLVKERSGSSEFPLDIAIHWPYRKALTRELRPYAGSKPNRFSVNLKCDDPGKAKSMKQKLSGFGFHHVNVISDISHDELFSITWGQSSAVPEIRSALTQMVEDEMAAMGADQDFELHHQESGPFDLCPDNEINVCLPVWGVEDGSRAARLGAPKNYQLYIKSPEPSEWLDVLKSFEGWCFSSLEVDDIALAEGNEIYYGGAPRSLLDKICQHLEGEFDLSDFRLQKRWSSEDKDIYIFLPKRSTDRTESPAPGFAEPSWQPPEIIHSYSNEPFIARSETHLRIGQIELPLRRRAHPATPSLEHFAHYSIDQTTADTLAFLAQSILLNEPCLLEGETATSKTSAIHYLGALLGQPVMRLNLSGQTDVSELIGRITNTTGQLPFDTETLNANQKLLRPESRDILAHAQREQRGLNSLEQQKIMALEGFVSKDWSWQEGALVTAIREGHLVVLDELNLAEPFVLERFNAVLEQPASLRVSENENECYGPGGRPIHEHFRIFATMNPAEYSGRSLLSPAYRNRWQAKRFVPDATQDDIATMLAFWIHGRQSAVHQAGVQYNATIKSAPFRRLQAIHGIDEFINRLAEFHHGLCELTRTDHSSDPLFSDERREGYVFSRRTLLSLMQFIDQQLANGREDHRQIIREALQRYYLEGLASETDKAAMQRHMEAIGIDPDSLQGNQPLESWQQEVNCNA